MKVKMLTMMAGPDGSCYPGDSIDVSDDEAAGLISGGFAVSIDEKEVPNDAVGSNGNRSATVKRRSKKESKTSA